MKAQRVFHPSSSLQDPEHLLEGRASQTGHRVGGLAPLLRTEPEPGGLRVRPGFQLRSDSRALGARSAS